MDGNIASGLGTAILILVILACIVTFGITCGVSKLIEKDEIVSDTLITPKVKYTVKDNKVDSVYIYPIN